MGRMSELDLQLKEGEDVRPCDLSGVVNTTLRVREYVTEEKGITSIPEVSALLQMYKAPEASVAFHFGIDRVTMYAGRPSGVSAMCVVSPRLRGVSGRATYTPSDAIRGLISYLGAVIVNFGAVGAVGDSKQYLCSLVPLIPGDIEEKVPVFRDVEALFQMAEQTLSKKDWFTD